MPFQNPQTPKPPLSPLRGLGARFRSSLARDTYPVGIFPPLDFVTSLYSVTGKMHCAYTSRRGPEGRGVRGWLVTPDAPTSSGRCSSGLSVTMQDAMVI